ncbi:hypothetical protein A3B05_00770 [Candidatus Giovannonibacteria bacterium RIFCSPLOWO2_01_FULL_43_160]|uniref:TrbC/VIRB2 family protein n=2 Tax=Candidatus Giovannoniibacteriota TaxID=1752738 RepID=A0A0G1L579_9BACT|nr:MAG: hypothetical protein UV72_C0001G0090 [Candidatus Giovannonibacteria bacterium GW2011_GWB1_43_13]KKS99707.1 MAG: hypothetical protein UV75_C0002G0088 [Candidatus Giovannonibacteria bacterium GW2011_GWA1_43_15]KKT21883.1 MAG: hypothetical protein UW05_C0001G0030 [Candidatus Giovannonibacteria bacterium GW2011_GWC2_43_8]KKT63792.1 MAG: hypothetical protein UW55_C0001G0085 [Candidatus Giovannonibacteria bacterium GW2011_GWA2_44_26]OGF58235.1 MAG: hypothetical protein A2652_00070 [Candidatus
MFINKTKIFLFSIIYAMLNIGTAYAEEYMLVNPINAGTFGQVVEKFAQLLTKIGIPIATVFLIWSGLLFVTARGNDDQLKKAKGTFYWTVVGTAILVGAYAIASAIVNFAEKL